MRRLVLVLVLLGGVASAEAETQPGPFVVVLGIAQDGGAPQAGSSDHPGWDDPAKRHLVSSLALVDPRTGQRWLFDATPDFPEQLQRLDEIAPAQESPGLAGIFLTHAHIGHYLGLAHLGREVIGARSVPVHAMPRMADFLHENGPWDQLVELGNVEVREMRERRAVKLAEDLSVTPLLVPHRDEYSETVAFRIDGPERSLLFLPDIDKWGRWETQLEKVLATVDVAYLDGTFFADGELPGRDMSQIPHPFIVETMDRLHELPAAERAKVRFIHLNHTNPALDPKSEVSQRIESAGFGVAWEGELQGL